MNNTNHSKRVVIVGGGFAGVTLAQQLGQKVTRDTEIVLLSSENHFVFTPLLAETAGREISPLHVIIPGRQMVKRAKWLTADVTAVDRVTNRIHYRSRAGHMGSIDYDHVVLACGSVVDLSTVPGLAEHAYPLKSVGDAIFLSNELIGRLEEAAVSASPEERQRLLTIVVIGGGFSGVEIAGALNDFLGRARKYYPLLRYVKPRVVLLHSGAHILPEFGGSRLCAYALKRLRAAGIEVRLFTKASRIADGAVYTDTDDIIPADTVVCTIGTAPNPLLRTLELPLERGRLRTDAAMRVEQCGNVWAIGDNAVVPNERTGASSPATAQFAMRQARQLAHNLASEIHGRPVKTFSFRPLGMMAAIGHHNAVAEVFGIRISGFLAWLLWRTVYLAKMPTLSRKVEVALDWTAGIFFPPNLAQLHGSTTHELQRKSVLGASAG